MTSRPSTPSPTTTAPRQTGWVRDSEVSAAAGAAAGVQAESSAAVAEDPHGAGASSDVDGGAGVDWWDGRADPAAVDELLDALR